jgi:hypothetical protein
MKIKFGNETVEAVEINNQEVKAELLALAQDVHRQIAMLARDEHAFSKSTRCSDRAAEALGEMVVRLQLNK